jgi:hypothetical protein
MASGDHKQKEYDPRSKPNRGVRVRPLPEDMHDVFTAFVSELRVHVDSHLSTWRAAMKVDDSDMTLREYVYWDSARRYLNTLEYMGTVGHDTSPNPRRIRPHRRRSR